MNDVEMSCTQRTFHEVGRKLLQRRPLELQKIHPEDGVLGIVRHTSGKGLNTTYEELIRKAFAKRFWSGEGDFGAPVNGVPYTQIEANFAFFFGLAIQLYEQTLISDQALFDTKRNAENVPIAFNKQQKRGLKVFMNAECSECHRGPTLSSAAHPQVYRGKKFSYNPLINRSAMFEADNGFGVAKSLIDTGFMITSVAAPDYDVGLGGKDPYGNPLSFVEQYVASLADPAKPMIDPIKVLACEMGEPFVLDFISTELIPDPNGKGYCQGYKGYSKVPAPAVVKAELNKPGQGLVMSSVKGAFKIPTLRNVELTGPFMHNGSMKSLEEVVEFYDRGGNNFNNPQHLETLVFPLRFTKQAKLDLVAFLKTLTDERVRWERAPFDHPELLVFNGHDQRASPLGSDYATDRVLHLPAIGKNGRTTVQRALTAFRVLFESLTTV